MSPYTCPFYGELSAEEAELLRVPHGTPVKLVKEMRTIKRMLRLIVRAATAAIVIVAVAIVVVVLI
jgi:hypothetical protein